MQFLFVFLVFVSLASPVAAQQACFDAGLESCVALSRNEAPIVRWQTESMLPGGGQLNQAPSATLDGLWGNYALFCAEVRSARGLVTTATPDNGSNYSGNCYYQSGPFVNYFTVRLRVICPNGGTLYGISSYPEVFANNTALVNGSAYCGGVRYCPDGYAQGGTTCTKLPACPTGEHYEGALCVCDAGYYRAPAEHRWSGQCIRQATGDDLTANPTWAGLATTQCGAEYSLYTNGSNTPEISCSATGGEPTWGDLVPLNIPVCAPSSFTPPVGAGYYMVVPYPNAGDGC